MNRGYPAATLADLYDPSAMPAPFPSDRHRVEYLFAFHEKLTAPFVAAAKPARKHRRNQTAA